MCLGCQTDGVSLLFLHCCIGQAGIPVRPVDRSSWEHVHLSVSVAVAQQMHLAVFVSVDKAKPEYFEASVAVDKDIIQ